MKTLEIGQDYGFAIGLPTTCKCVYLGGNLWRQEQAGKPSREAPSDKMVQIATEYINRPSVKMGEMV